MPQLGLGLDFGTTNTVAALAEAGGGARPLPFAFQGAEDSAFRSVLCFWKEALDRRHEAEAGPWAIERYLDLAGEARFVQSFKSFAASKLFVSTQIFGVRFGFEDLLAAFLRIYRAHLGAELPKRVVIGRPVRFVGADPDERLAHERYETALRAAGFEEIHHVFEPVAAAYFYAQRLRARACVLVADFGGGTSDFSLVEFTPKPGGVAMQPLARSGVGVAGDAFDARLIDRFVAPLFGKGSFYKSWDKVLPIPDAYFESLRNWHQLSLLRHTKDFAELRRLAKVGLEPERLEAFIAFLETDATYLLNRAVTDVKVALSRQESATLSLRGLGVNEERLVTRADFAKLIAPELEKISAAVDAALAEANLSEDQIDRVFLTGGSSFVPAVQALFQRRFGPAKIEGGEQLVSIAYGLALIAAEDDISPWSISAG